MDQIAFVHVVLASAKPSAPHAAAIENLGEATLDQLAATAHRLASDPGSQPRPISVDRSPSVLVAMPAQVALVDRIRRLMPTGSPQAIEMA